MSLGLLNGRAGGQLRRSTGHQDEGQASTLQWPHSGVLRGLVTIKTPDLGFGLVLVAWKSRVTNSGFSKTDPAKSQAEVDKTLVPHLFSRNCGKWLMQEQKKKI